MELWKSLINPRLSTEPDSFYELLQNEKSLHVSIGVCHTYLTMISTKWKASKARLSAKSGWQLQMNILGGMEAGSGAPLPLR